MKDPLQPKRDEFVKDFKEKLAQQKYLEAAEAVECIAREHGPFCMKLFDILKLLEGANLGEHLVMAADVASVRYKLGIIDYSMDQYELESPEKRPRLRLFIERLWNEAREIESRYLKDDTSNESNK